MAKRTIRVEIDIDPSKFFTRKRPVANPKKHAAYLYAKEITKVLARERRLRVCTVDDVKEALERSGRDANILGCTVSGVFRSLDWERTPLDLRARAFGSRLRDIGMWRLRPDGYHYAFRERKRRPVSRKRRRRRRG